MVAAFNCDRVHELAAEFGYTRCQFDDHQGLAAFRRTDTEDGTPEIVRVWWRTRTVETQLKHPGQVANSLYRKNVPNYTVLRAIFDYPRDGRGYRRNPEKNTPCPGCGKRFRGAVGAVSHFEDGHCKNCRGADKARRAVYKFVQDNNVNFTLDRIGYSSDGDGYDSDGNNYICHGCSKQFRTLKSMMQHQENKASCRDIVSFNPSTMQLGTTAYYSSDDDEW